MKLIKIKGIYTDNGAIQLENKKLIHWHDLTNEKQLDLPFGSKIEMLISINEDDFLSGEEGVVWASFDIRQIEVIKNALSAQNINSEIKIMSIKDREIFLLKIISTADINDSINFIWKSNTGLRLKPDWTYPEGEVNKSFEQWLSGH